MFFRTAALVACLVANGLAKPLLAARDLVVEYETVVNVVYVTAYVDQYGHTSILSQSHSSKKRKRTSKTVSSSSSTAKSSSSLTTPSTTVAVTTTTSSSPSPPPPPPPSQTPQAAAASEPAPAPAPAPASDAQNEVVTVTIDASQPTAQAQQEDAQVFSAQSIPDYSHGQGKSSPASSGSDSGDSSPMTSDNQSYLSVLNKYRGKLGLPSLKWDQTLADAAGKTAQHSLSINKQDHQTNHLFGTCGEVIAPGSISSNQQTGLSNFENIVVFGWLCEVYNPDYCDYSTGYHYYTYGGETGHYEVLASKDYDSVGCSYVAGVGGDSTNAFWVCDLASSASAGLGKYTN